MAELFWSPLGTLLSQRTKYRALTEESCQSSLGSSLACTKDKCTNGCSDLCYSTYSICKQLNIMYVYPDPSLIRKTQH